MSERADFVQQTVAEADFGAVSDTSVQHDWRASVVWQREQ